MIDPSTLTPGTWVHYYTNPHNAMNGWPTLGQITRVYTGANGQVTLDLSSASGGYCGLRVERVAGLASDADREDIRWHEMIRAAVDWTYLQVIGGGITRKSALDGWLMQKFCIDAYTARQVSNTVTAGPIYFTIDRDGGHWCDSIAGRAAPTLADYPDFVLEPH